MTRPKTIALKRLAGAPDPANPFTPAEPSELAALDRADRPRTRGDCAQGPRPCPFAACKHHLYLDVNEDTGALRLTFPDRGIEELDETCALDVADRDGATLEQVGQLINLTRERIRQIEVRGLLNMKPYSYTPGDPDF